MVLLTSFFPTTPERAAEITGCLEHNLQQPFFTEVSLLCEKNARPGLTTLWQSKLAYVPIDERPTYRMFFACAAQRHPGQIVVVSNADILYDKTLRQFEDLPAERWNRRFFAITRTNEDGHLQNPGSHDTWVFRAPLPAFDADLVLGIIGCDSFLAQKALEAGLRVENPAYSVRCSHRHHAGARNDCFADQTNYWTAPGYRALNIPYSSL